MRSDIAASIRQGRWSSRTHAHMQMDRDSAQENAESRDGEDERNETTVDKNDFQSCVSADEMMVDLDSDDDDDDEEEEEEF